MLRLVAVTVEFWRKTPSQAHVLSSPWDCLGPASVPFCYPAGTGAGVSHHGGTGLPGSSKEKGTTEALCLPVVNNQG